MTETLSFSDNFWGDKHQGYDVLYQNTKACSKTSTEFLELLRDVYSMEETCTRAWGRVSRQINVQTAGSLQPYWQALKDLSEKHGNVHFELGQNIQQVIKAVQKYIDEQQSRQKATKDLDLQTQNINNLLLGAQSQLLRAKEAYDSRYQEFQKFHKSDQNITNKTRELERLETKLKKAVDEYKYNIEKYNNTCAKFKSKMVESCQSFQEIETYHLEQMKEFICRFANSLFKAQTDLKEQHMEFMKTQENYSVQSLLENFIKLKSTGKIPPQVVTFEDASSPDIKNITRLSKDTTDSFGDTGLNGNHTNDVITGNLLNIDSSSDISSPHVSNINLAVQNKKESSNDIFEQLSNMSDNNSINFQSATNEVPNAPATIKKQKKYNPFRRPKRNSPLNGVNQKSFQDADKEKSSQSLGEFLVDEEGYSIKPNTWVDTDRNSSSDSSSDDDKSNSFFKGIKVEIKPQETKSDSSSITENDLQTKNNVKSNDNLELIKAVQALKITPNPVREVGRNRGVDSRSNTPSLSTGSADNTFPINNNTVSIRDSRRKKNHHSQSESNSTLLQPHFQVEFGNAAKPNGLDLAVMHDSFNSRFDSFSNSTSDLPDPKSDKVDPWGPSFIEGQSQPPPLPAKIIPPRAASTVPFTTAMESSKFSSLISTPISIPATPSRLTLNAIEGIPLAVAFTETVNAKFRESFSTTPHDVHTSGQLVISFPCSMLQQFDNIGENHLNTADPIHFSLTQAGRLRNVEPISTGNDISIKIENPNDDSYFIYIDLLSLHKKLTSLRRKEPSLPFFNIDIIKYDVTNNVKPNGNINAPVHVSANWQITDALSSHLMITYSFHWPNTDVASLTFRPSPAKPGNSDIGPHGEVRFLVLADGMPHKMQSLPPSIWNSELGRASWRLDLSKSQGSIKSKFFLTKGPGTPQPVVCQFSAEGSIESGVLLQVFGNRFRISRHKYRLISGRYVWEPSSMSGFCV